jgi:5'(3')-deoxyribonucleotidase
LDCDGVLADFDSVAASVFGLPSRKAEAELGTERFWVDLQTHPGFYRNLPLLPEGRRLYEAVAHLQPTILTGCPRGGWAEPQKEAWSAENFPGVPMICCASRYKRNYCQPGDILIDDWDKYRNLWEDAGGVFIHYRGYESTMQSLYSMAVI